MAKSKKELMALRCTVCGRTNYTSRKSKGLIEAKKKFEITKYCRKCRKHTEHKESKK
ncbi:50S ribosomal protein L33 [Candidatus Berkelbacteria bacterium]|nr:50S ribosomal protein L33 [Candidatus Berkelbacteria bacterium]